MEEIGEAEEAAVVKMLGEAGEAAFIKMSSSKVITKVEVMEETQQGMYSSCYFFPKSVNDSSLSHLRCLQVYMNEVDGGKKSNTAKVEEIHNEMAKDDAEKKQHFWGIFIHGQFVWIFFLLKKNQPGRFTEMSKSRNSWTVSPISGFKAVLESRWKYLMNWFKLCDKGMNYMVLEGLYSHLPNLGSGRHSLFIVTC